MNATEPRSLAHDWFPQPLPANVFIGERSWCYSSFAFLHYRSSRPCGVRVGCDSGIYHGTYFDLGPDGEVSIGDFATIVGAIVSTNGRVTIGDYVFIAHEVVLADHFAGVPGVAAGAVTSEAGPAPDGLRNRDRGSNALSIRVGDNVWIGARAVLLSGAAIGEGAIIGAAAVVDFEVPPFAIVAGNPARVVGSVQT
jgi:acetyltransferase-like isoleucine patch superfamily enzyme